MNKVPIVDILKGHVPPEPEEEVTIQGWVRTRRDSKIGISFLTIYDGSCLHSLQAVIHNTLKNYNNEILQLTTGCSVTVTGQVVASIGVGQSFEMHVTKLTVLGWVEDPNRYPISTKHHSMKYLREVAHLRPRTNIIGAVTRVRHTLAQAIHQFMNSHGFLWVSTPLITSSDTEGTSQMFRVSTLDLENLPRTPQGKINYEKDFFSKETFLTVSGQLNGESYACALSKIYTFGPIFRAENSNTSRHLAEFWMVEPEVAFATLSDISILVEKMLKYIFRVVLTERYDDMIFFSEKTDPEAIHRLNTVVSTNFAQIDYTRAIEILQTCGKIFEHPVFWGRDLTSEHERYLSDTYFNSPVVIKHAPKDIKAFYMRMNDDGQTVASMDVLVPGIGEIIGGSQREERLEHLDYRLNEMGLNKEDYWWYRDLRRYGTVPHSGFGLGLERLISYITGIKNIKDVIPFPRSPRNANF